MKTKTRDMERREGFALRPIAYGVMLACCGSALANPVGPNVAAGAAGFATQGKTLTVTNAPGTIINWQSFSIGTGELTRFNQQSASSAVLNRVVGNVGSMILGTLSSNGRVFLVNPHGIIFGAGARIDTAGFIASTLNIADKDFLSGKLKFEGGGNGILRNEGTIRAASDIVLVGPVVENAGLIRSESGSVLLAAGRSVTITSPNAQGVKFEVQAPTDSVLNLGTIEAADAASMLAGTLRHSGDIRAGSASVEAGRVVLLAQKDAIVDAGASITANGAQGGNVTIQSGDLAVVSGRVEATGSAGPGGTVQVLGKRVGVFEGGSIDASGTSGGGTILIGGDYQGNNPDIPNASQTIVASGARLKADAIENGDGGKVIVWADNSTRFGGEISARGGAQSGDGGLVEVSGKKFLDFRGDVDTRAPNGNAGTLLLDPTTINIVDAFTSGGIPTELFGDRSAPADSRFQETGTFAPDISELLASDLKIQLQKSDVVISTESSGSGAGNINFNAPLDFDGAGTNRKLTLITVGNGSIDTGNINLTSQIADSVSGSADSLRLVLISRGTGVTNISSTMALGPNGFIDASRDGSGVININRPSATSLAIGAPISAQRVTFNHGAGPGPVPVAVVGGSITANAISLQSGILDVQNFPGAAGVLPQLDMSGGTLTRTIPGNLVITGPFVVSGGSIGAGPAGAVLRTEAVTTVNNAVTIFRDWLNANVVNLGSIDSPNSTARIDLQPNTKFLNQGTLNLFTTNLTPFGTTGDRIVNGAEGVPGIAGTFNKNSPGPSNIGVVFENTARGTVNVNGGGNANDLIVSNGMVQRGVVEIASGSKLSTGGGNLQNQATGTIGGSGTVDVGNGTLDNFGILRPGGAPGSGTDPIGTLTIEGNLALNTAAVPSDGSRVSIEVRGPNGDHDKINVTAVGGPLRGNATLGGTLNVTHLNGFEPEGSAPALQIMNYASLTGTSDFFTKNYPAGYIYTEQATPTNYQIQVSLTPSESVWTGGNGDFAWESEMNWNGPVPTAAINARIPDIGNAGANFTIIISTANQAARKLTSFENVRVQGANSSLTLGASNSTVINGISNNALVEVTTPVAPATLSVVEGGLLTANRMTVTGSTVAGAGRVVVMPTGPLTLNGAIITSTGGITATGPTTLTTNPSLLSGRLTTVGDMTMGNGVFDGGLTIQDGGRLTLGPGTKNIAAASNLIILSGGTMNLTGDLTLQGNASIGTNPGGRIEIADGNARIVAAAAASAVFSNAGTIVKLGSSESPPSTFTLGNNDRLTFTNSGTLDVQSPTATIVYGAAGGAGGNQFQNGTRFIGAGAHQVTVDSTFGNVTSNGLTLAAGDFFGTATLNGATTWTGGRIRGDFTFPQNSTLNMDGNLAKSVDGAAAKITTNGVVNVNGAGNTLANGAVWDNFGVVNLSGAARITLDTNAMLRNRPDAFIHSNSSNATVIAAEPGSSSSVLNEGTFGKELDSFASQAIDARFRNTGIVNVRAGTLKLQRGNGGGDLGPDSGTYVVSDDAGSPPAVLEVAGGSRDFAANVAGAPGILLPLVGDGTLKLSGGVLDVRGGRLPRLDMEGPATTLTRSTSGNLTIAGPFNVSGGAITGSDELVTQGTTTITGVVTAIRDWRNTGVLTLAAGTGAGGQISPSPGANFTFTNGLFGTVNLSTPQAKPFSELPAPSDASIANFGTFNKTATGAGVSEIAHPFTNETFGGNFKGTINVDSGTLRLTSMPTNAGRIRIAENTRFETGGVNNLTNAASGEIGGLGTIDLGAGRTLTNNGTLIPGGTGAPAGATRLTGQLNVVGNLKQGDTGSIEVLLTGTADGSFDKLAVTGSVELNGTLDVSRTTAYTPAERDSFTVITATGPVTGSFDAITRVGPGGGDFGGNEIIPTYNPNVTLTIGPKNRNTWIFDGSGDWTDAGRWSQNREPIVSDTVMIDRPGALTITLPALRSGGVPGLYAAGILTSNENITLAGTLNLAGASTINATLALNGGTLGSTPGGAGKVTVNGNTSVGTGASQLNTTLATNGLSMTAGSLTVGPSGTLGLTGDGTTNLPKTIANSTLNNNNRINLGGTSDLVLNGGAALNNNSGATLDIQSNVNIVRTSGAGATPILTNAGTIFKSGIGGNSTIGGGGFELTSISNNGTYTVGAGNTLTHAATNAFNDGTDFLGLGTNVVTSSSSFGGTITSTGLTLRSGNYTVTGPGPVSFAGTTAWAGGNLVGTFTIPASATFNVAGGGATTVDPATTIANAGTINLAGSQTFVAFSNTSTVNINAGTLSLAGSGTDTGTYSIPAGSTLDLTGGTRNFNGALALTGAGRLRSSANLNVNKPLVLASAGVTFDMIGGVLTDAGGLTLNGAFNWSGGTIAGGGPLTTGATAATTITGPVTLSGKNWDNFGPIALTGNSQIVLDGPAAVATTLVNRGTGVITDTSTNATPITTATTRTGKLFSNTGTFDKNAGSAATQTLDVPMTNGIAGKINVRSGTLVANGFPSNDGIIDLDNNATFSTGPLPFTNNAPFGSITGNGTIVAAPFTNNGSLGPGDSPGALTVSGNYVQGPSGTLVIELGGPTAGTTYDVLNVTGNANLNGALVLFVTAGQTIGQGNTFDFMTYGSRTGDFASFAIPAGQTFQLAPGPTGYRVTTTTPPPAVINEINRIGQKDVLVLAERRADNVLVPDQQQQQSDDKKKTLGECK